jgi:T-complex protein 1 subunit epsilon
MSVVFDEYGRPFVILREQQAKARIKGVEVKCCGTRSHVIAAMCDRGPH